MKKYQVMFVDKNDFIEYPYSLLKTVSIVAFYFIFVLYVFPYVASYIAIQQNPMLTSLPLIYQFSIYLVASLLMILLTFKLLRKECFLSLHKLITTIISCVVLLTVINLAFSIFYEMIGLIDSSANQSGLETIAIENITLFVVMVCVLAPLIEELVFRGVMFRYLRKHLNFFFASLVSSFAFGFVHIMSSFFLQDYADCMYIFLYASLGFVFSYAYEYNKTIYACIILHATYNFLGCIGIIFS